MSLAPGTRVGPYEIIAPLGAGGMGEVYRARDTTLNREVALKVLPGAFIQDPDRLARFKREARVLASLNHPNIAAIYGFEASDRVLALVLELVDGPTLADRIAQGPIPLDELHDIAEESSHSGRRADEAERELMEWKKVKFMQDRVGEDFDGLITSVTKFGFFVELTNLFVEGLVPLNTLTDDYYTYHENTRQIIGQHTRKTYSLGQRIRVLVDRIDPVEKKIQFAVLEEQPKRAEKSRRR